MIYAEAAYFDGAHVQHIADYQEQQRLKRLRREAARMVERRRGSRARASAVCAAAPAPFLDGRVQPPQAPRLALV